jgi:ABC-2 type transport system permease protein
VTAGPIGLSRSTNGWVALALAWRQVSLLLKNPSLFVPPLLFPLMNLLAFAGGLSRLRHVPGFEYGPGYTGFTFVFVLLQAAAFSGVFTGFGIARDFENGFARRLLVAAPHRSGLIVGYGLGALFRWIAVAAMLTVVALAFGMHVGGDGTGLFGVYALAVIVNACGVLWSSGIAFRFRTVQAGPLMQTPVFLLLFLAPVYVPLALLTGWIHAVASLNPMTAILTAGRGFLAGDPQDLLVATAVVVGSSTLLIVWSRRGLAAAERAG